MPLKIVRQDITKMQVDAVVNTTNENMTGFSGVDLAVHKAAGPELERECAGLVPLGLGEAKLTKAYGLDAKFIIHASGPVWKGGLCGESIILRSCYESSLRLAVENGCETVAFPLISSGAYGYPKDKVLKFAVSVISEFLFEHELTVYLCVFDRSSYEFSRTLFSDISAVIGTDALQNCEAPVASKTDFLKRRAERNNGPCFQDGFAAVSMQRCSQKMGTAEKSDLSLKDYMKEIDKPFALKLFELIDKRNMTDVECYKKANVDKKTFSKIKCNPMTYRPSKQTAVAFAIALKLDIDETQEFLASAGLTLSQSFIFDKIIRYFIQKGNYDIFEINEALFEFDQVLLG